MKSLIIVGALAIAGIIAFSTYSSVYNMGNTSEQNIIALQKQS